ncbi:MAG: hypothetical protein U1A78_34030 [Polyangia bacterium]
MLLPDSVVSGAVRVKILDFGIAKVRIPALVGELPLSRNHGIAAERIFRVALGLSVAPLRSAAALVALCGLAS